MHKSSRGVWRSIFLVIVGIIISIGIVLAAVFSGLTAFGNGNNTVSSSITKENNGDNQITTGVFTQDGQDGLLLNPYYLRDVIHGMTLVLTENNEKLGKCFEGCYNRFFKCPEMDQRDECEEEALILRECVSHTLCIKECIEECDRYGETYPRTGFQGSRCVDFRNSKLICP